MENRLGNQGTVECAIKFANGCSESLLFFKYLKAENVESVEDQDKPDGSSGSCTGNERNEPVDNDVSLADGDSEGTGNSITHKNGMEFADSVTTNNTTQTISNDTVHRYFICFIMTF